MKPFTYLNDSHQNFIEQKTTAPESSSINANTLLCKNSVLWTSIIDIITFVHIPEGKQSVKSHTFIQCRAQSGCSNFIPSVTIIQPV